MKSCSVCSNTNGAAELAQTWVRYTSAADVNSCTEHPVSRTPYPPPLSSKRGPSLFLRQDELCLTVSH
ncbi:hypothetical protein INR49_005920 [Caranx melampygus]|nr:hypothetical protein INR49_005920 [Caranx melampygus]